MADARMLFEELRSFLEEAEVSRAASKPLKEGIEIGIQFEGFPEKYRVVKDNGRLAVRAGESASPDWTAVISPKSVHAINDMPNADIGDLGVEVFRRMARGYSDPQSEDTIKVHLTSGFFNIMRKGYLGMLPLGGPKVARWLAQHGLKNISGIKRVFKKLRGGED